MSTNDLFQPSLSAVPAGRSVRPPLSSRATFIVSFFGGTFATLMVQAFNSRQLGRLKQDAWVYLAGGILTVVAIAFILRSTGLPPGSTLAQLAEIRRDSLLLRMGPRLLSLILWLGIYLLHRPQLAAYEGAGLPPQSPWKIGFFCLLVGGGMNALVGYGLFRLMIGAA